MINNNLSKITDSQFKYTIDEERRDLVKAIYPILNEVMKIPQQIPWQTYKYEGPNEVWEVSEETTNFYDPLGKLSFQIVKKPITASYPDGSAPFQFFGGCVYEILHNQLYNQKILGKSESVNVPNIRDFLDPTGDVDVLISRPQITFLNELGYDPLDYDYRDLEKTAPSTLVEHWTHWVFERVVELIRNSSIPEYFEGVVEDINFANLTDSELTDTIENIVVGKILITRAKVNDMLKIQCTVKLPSQPENHFMEFVYSLKNGDDVIRFKDFSKGMIQPLKELYFDNLNAIIDRLVFIGDVKQHKLYNHVQRLCYLNRIVPLMKNKYKEQLRSLPPSNKSLCFFLRFMCRPDKYALLGSPDYLFRESFKELKEFLQIESNRDTFCKMFYNEKENECTYEQKLKNVRTLIGNILDDDVIVAIFGNSNSYLIDNNIKGVKKFIDGKAADVWELRGGRRSSRKRKSRESRKTRKTRKSKH